MNHDHICLTHRDPVNNTVVSKEIEMSIYSELYKQIRDNHPNWNNTQIAGECDKVLFNRSTTNVKTTNHIKLDMFRPLTNKEINEINDDIAPKESKISKFIRKILS